MDLGGYMRVSRKGDRDPDQWLTVPAQRAAILGWIDQRGHRLADLREDIDVSGALDDRPNLEQLVEQVERGELGGLVVAKVDRFSRDLAYGAMIARRIERAGGTFVAADDGVVIGPAGRDFGSNDTAHFLFAQLLSMADFFRRRTVQGWRQVRERHVLERGRHWGYAPPFGYLVGAAGRLEVDERWGQVVTEVFERRARGEGMSAIARWLDDQGARSARGGRPTHRFVKDMLVNRVYLGEARAGEFVLEGAHPPLVDEGLFASAERRVVGPQRRVSFDESQAPVLSGLVRCWACRTVMTGGFGAYQGDQRRVYRCRRRHAHGICPAPASAPEAELLELVEPLFWEILGADARARDIPDDNAEGGRLVDARDRARRGLEVYRDAIGLAELDAALVADGLRVHQQRLREAQAALDDWQRGQTKERVDVTQLRAAWVEMPPKARSYLLASMIGAIVVRKSDEARRGHAIPLGGRAAVLLLDDLPDDLPRPGRPPRALRSFAPFDDEAMPWMLLGE